MTFDTHRLHRVTDPDTSREAANQVDLFGHNHEQLVLDALRRLGPLTASQIAAFTPLDPVQVNRRLAGMAQKGMAETTGDKRRNQSGRSERVWRAL